MTKIIRPYPVNRRRSWQSVLHAVETAHRSEHGLYPQQYFAEISELEQDATTPSESTPLNMKRVNRRTSQHLSATMSWRNQFTTRFVLHLLVVGIAGFCDVWLQMFPISPNRLYNMKVDVFNNNHEHATFFFKQCLYLGTICGATFAGLFGERLGRVGTLELASIPYVVGWLLVGAAYGQVSVMTGRYLLGVSIGMIHVVVPIYLAELSAAKYRGRVTSLFVVLANLGQVWYLALGALIVFLSRTYFSFNLSEWKVLAMLGLFPGLALLLMSQFLFESASWLIVQHNERETAFLVLSSLFNDCKQFVELQVNSIIHCDLESVSNSRSSSGNGGKNANFLRLILLCCSLFTLRAISSFFIEPSLVPMYSRSYGISMFGVVLNFGEMQVLWFCGFLWLGGALGTLGCFLLIDRQGRKFAMTAGCGAAAFCSVMIMISESQGIHISPSNILEVANSGTVAILLITAGHYLGLVVCPMVYVGELFPAKHRCHAVSLVIISENFVALALSYFATHRQASVETISRVFGYGLVSVFGCNVAAIYLVLRYFPETSQRSLQEIESAFSGWRVTTPHAGASTVVMNQHHEGSGTDSKEPFYGTV